jgi:tRNA pseudouridine(38-40) synthase
VWHVQNAKSFEISRAQECASILRGEHDFIAFRGAFRGNERGKIQNTICRLQEITITEEEDGDQFPFCTTYKVTVTGDRFLYKMMRFIVGTLVEYGIKEKLSLQEVSNALSTGEWGGVVDDAPSCPRTCAPANGLVLDNIDYGDKWDFDWIAESL